MLKITGIKLETMTEPSMIGMIQQAIRGGQSFITQREAFGDARLDTPGEKLLYIDANNLVSV